MIVLGFVTVTIPGVKSSLRRVLSVGPPDKQRGGGENTVGVLELLTRVVLRRTGTRRRIATAGFM